MSLFGKVKKAVKKAANVATLGQADNLVDVFTLGQADALKGALNPPAMPTGPSSGAAPMAGVPQLPGVMPQRQDNSALIQQLMGGQRMNPAQFMQQMGGGGALGNAPGAPVPSKPLIAPGMPMPGMQPGSPQMGGGQFTTQIQPPQPGNFMPMPQQGQPNPSALAAILQGVRR